MRMMSSRFMDTILHQVNRQERERGRPEGGKRSGEEREGEGNREGGRRERRGKEKGREREGEGKVEEWSHGKKESCAYPKPLFTFKDHSASHSSHQTSLGVISLFQQHFLQFPPTSFFAPWSEGGERNEGSNFFPLQENHMTLKPSLSRIGSDQCSVCVRSLFVQVMLMPFHSFSSACKQCSFTLTSPVLDPTIAIFYYCYILLLLYSSIAIFHSRRDLHDQLDPFLISRPSTKSQSVITPIHPFLEGGDFRGFKSSSEKSQDTQLERIAYKSEKTKKVRVRKRERSVTYWKPYLEPFTHQ